MAGLVKMYLYRMSRSTGLVISLVLCCLCVFIPVLEQSIVIISMLFANINTVSAATLHVLSLGLPCAVIAVYLSAIFSADYSNGFIKNIIPAVKSRNTIFLARTVVTVLFTTVVYILVCAFSYFLYGIVKGYNAGFDASYFKMLFFLYIMSLAFLMIINTMTILTRGMVMAVMVAVSSVTGFTTIPVALAETIIAGSFNPMYEAHWYTYLISDMMKNIVYEFSAVKILGMCAVYVAVSVAASLLVLNLRDEK